MPLRKIQLTATIVLATLTIQMTTVGCMTLGDVRAVRDLPGLTAIPSAKNVVFDPGIRAARDKKTGLAFRDSLSKKIMTEDELVRVTNSHSSPKLGTGSTIAGITIAIIYVPIGLALGIAEWVITLPVQPYFSYLAHAYPKIGEEAYTAGRQHFSSGDINAALIDWERARTATPNLLALSDMNYWRGRAFQVLGDSESAQSAFRAFIEYSERVIPESFKNQTLADATWTERARDTDERLRSLVQAAHQDSP
jgi:hypothetical protein